jgi:Uma2 family endonuclease
LSWQNRETYYQLAPDLAIEILSPSERAVDIRTKLNDYLRTGVRQVWQVYAETREVVVHLAGGSVRIHTLGLRVFLFCPI